MVVINDCAFETIPQVFGGIPWYRPLVVWVVLTFAEVLGVFLNYETKWDNIKWIGTEDLNIFENIFIRMTGWYFF